MTRIQRPTEGDRSVGRSIEPDQGSDMTIRREDGLGDSRDLSPTISDPLGELAQRQLAEAQADPAWRAKWAIPSSTTPAPGERSREANPSHLEGLAERLEADADTIHSWERSDIAERIAQAAALLRSQAVEIEGLKDEKDAAYADRARDTVTASERIFKLVQDLRAAEARAERAEAERDEARHCAEVARRGAQDEETQRRAAEASLSRLQADLKLKEEVLREARVVLCSMGDWSAKGDDTCPARALLPAIDAALTPETPDGK